MSWVVKGRYTDIAAVPDGPNRCRRAAEVQWDLLPPLACSTEQVAVSGILEPAYEIGGDSFDYAFDETRVDFTIVDAIGHGMSAVLMSAAAINSLRNSRRAERRISRRLRQVDESIATQFGDSYYVTGMIGSLDLPTGTLTWVNAGHVLPMLVRNGTYGGRCAALRRCRWARRTRHRGRRGHAAERRPGAVLHRRDHRGAIVRRIVLRRRSTRRLLGPGVAGEPAGRGRPSGTSPTAS